MNVLVIENEKPAADKICRLIRKIDTTTEILGVLETVESSVDWLQNNPAPDLILMDIQLDDGLCFEIFESTTVEAPVIFTTAYDEYTLRAFKVNSVDYLLKPIEESALADALAKYRKVYSGRIASREDIEKIIRDLSGQYKSRFLIRTTTGFKAVQVSDISHFHICERNVFLRDKSGKDYGLDYSLDQLQKVLDPAKFFRINRDCIISIDSISKISAWSTSRLKLSISGEKDNDIFIVSRDKTGEFKKWIDK